MDAIDATDATDAIDAKDAIDSIDAVMANIAEGFARRSNKEFTQFLFVAMSSAAEVQSHLYVAADQGYVSKPAFDAMYQQADKTSRIISPV